MGEAATSQAGDGLIEFLCDPAHADLLPPPEPALRFLPDWFRRLDREMGMLDAHGLPGLTAKACPPMVDAFSLGWIIPLPFDVRLTIELGQPGMRLGWDPAAPFTPIEQHHPGQVGFPNAPFDGAVPLKWINPWRIKVPDGYSVLFLHPLNHLELPFTCLSGLVDCDRFHTTVNFPFAWSLAPRDVTVRRGTPMAQVVPVRRDALLRDHAVRASTPEEMAEQAATSHTKYTEESAYARQWREKKK